MTFRDFADQIKGLATNQVALISGARDIPPTLTLMADDVPYGVLVDSGWFTPEARDVMVEQLVVPLIEVMRPQFVAWTFTGRRGALEGEWQHETAVAVCIDRERHETWLARLVRHNSIASLGAWRPWPANEQEGRLLTPIQDALR